MTANEYTVNTELHTLSESWPPTVITGLGRAMVRRGAAVRLHLPGFHEPQASMLAFTTVGSTKFDALVRAVLAKPVLTALCLQGYTTLVVQCGTSEVDLGISEGIITGDTTKLQKEGLDIEIWKFKPSLESEYDRADLVISHAGSGTILDVLRLGKWLIVVPNPTLLDNHQEDLASSLNALGHLKASTIDNLPQAIEEFDPSSIVPFPPFNGSKFASLLDDEMGFL